MVSLKPNKKIAWLRQSKRNEVHPIASKPMSPSRPGPGGTIAFYMALPIFVSRLGYLSHSQKWCKWLLSVLSLLTLCLKVAIWERSHVFLRKAALCALRSLVVTVPAPTELNTENSKLVLQRTLTCSIWFMHDLSLYNINRIVLVTEVKLCSLRRKNWIFIYHLNQF